jgi:hypothetical protein
MSNSTNSNLIHGFSNYKSLSNFFQNLAQDLKSKGECNLGGHTLLERFCEADGVTDRRTIKAMFDKIDNPFLSVKCLESLYSIWQESNNESFLNEFFDNNSTKKIRYLEKHSAFSISTPIDEIVFGETKKYIESPEKINKNAKKYFVINVGDIHSESPIEDKSYTSNDFFSCLGYFKTVLDMYLNNNYLDSINDSTFLNIIKENSHVKNAISEHWELTNKNKWTDDEIIDQLNSIFTFEREISPDLINRFRDHFNQHLYFNIKSYDNETAYDNHLGYVQNDTEEPYLFFKDAINRISKPECDGDFLIYIESVDEKIDININIYNIEKLKELDYIT